MIIKLVNLFLLVNRPTESILRTKQRREKVNRTKYNDNGQINKEN